MLLEIDDLRTHYHSRGAEVRAVDGVSFALAEGENLGLVGESGCGKTTLSKSLLRIVGENASIVSGEIRYDGTDLARLSNSEMNRYRWKQISMIAQSAMNALDPVYTAGDQIVETLRLHTDLTRADARHRATELFELVGLSPQRLWDYPHQLSGGMRQRVVIALALALDPRLIIADEPTTALDVVVQDGIIRRLDRIQQRLDNSMILVTHDVSLVAEVCDRIAVMYAGRIMEIGTSREIFSNASHPYTMGLLNAYPTLESAKGALISIPGSPPDLSKPTVGCPFAPRCPFRTEICGQETPPAVEVSPGHISACHHAGSAAEMRAGAGEQSRWASDHAPVGGAGEGQPGAPGGGAVGDHPGVPGAPGAAAVGGATGDHVRAPGEPATGDHVRAPGEPAAGDHVRAPGEPTPGRALLEIANLRRIFPLKRGLTEFLRRTPELAVRAVDGVSLEVGDGEIVGLAGESGSGKSTLGEVVVGLQPPSDGSLTFRGEPLFQGKRVDPAMRRTIQMAFQDPYETLNPRFTVFQTVVEPLHNFNIGDDAVERRELVRRALTEVELVPAESYLDRYPHELSGGQRQRVAIARAIVCGPKLLVADEPVSMLDVSIRAGVLNLFRRFRSELGMSIVYVSHDLATIRYICDRTAVLYLGRLAELGPTEEVIERPRHPYTRLLLSAVPRSNPDEERAHVDARGEIPSPISIPNGCRFHARCPYAMAHCGWEGADLARIIRSRLIDAEMSEELIAAGAQIDESGGPSRRLEAARIAPLKEATLDVDGTDLYVSTVPALRDEAIEAVRAVLDASLTTIAQAVVGLETVGGNAFVVRFARTDEPAFYPVDKRHRVACFLYETEPGEERERRVVAATVSPE